MQQRDQLSSVHRVRHMVLYTGAVYEGQWSRDVKEGSGTHRHHTEGAHGITTVSRFADNLPVGEGARWSASGKIAWRLQDGKPAGKLTLDGEREVDSNTVWEATAQCAVGLEWICGCRCDELRCAATPLLAWPKPSAPCTPAHSTSTHTAGSQLTLSALRCLSVVPLTEAMAIASGLGVLSTVAVPMQRALRKQADDNGAKAREVTRHILCHTRSLKLYAVLDSLASRACPRSPLVSSARHGPLYGDAASAAADSSEASARGGA